MGIFISWIQTECFSYFKPIVTLNTKNLNSFFSISLILSEKNECIQTKIQINFIHTTYIHTYLITDTCLGLIGPHQCDAEYHIDRKILSAMGESNPVLTGERPEFYHYTSNSPIAINIV